MSAPHSRIPKTPPIQTEDLLDLIQWNASTATHELVSRKLEECFTNSTLCSTCGPVLLILNPFCTGIEGMHIGTPGLEENLRKLATQAHENLASSGLPQVVFFTGESASGKTFSSQRFLRELFLLSGGKGSGTDLFKNVLASITVLRALCSARTAISPDSSRMMRLFELYYKGRSLQGAKIKCYFLDQNRVTASPPREQNYNIFYQMLAGVRPEDRGRLRLEGYTYKHFHILSECQSPQETQDTLIRKYEAWKTCLGALRIPHLDVLRILGAILLIGNVEFVQSSDGTCKVYGEKELVSSAVLLGLSSRMLREVLLGGTGTGESKKSRVTSAFSNNVNITLRVLSRALYTRLLGAVLRRINEQLHKFPSISSSNSPTLSQEDELSIIVADMFGFDTSNNGLEQFCANWTSELMQQSYYECVFKVTTDYLRDDGIDTDMNFELCSGSPCLSLLSNPINGLISLISEYTPVDNPHKPRHGLLRQMRNTHRANKRFVDLGESSELFGVIHFTGQVVYDCKKLVHANFDTISGDLVQIFAKDSCSFSFATSLFSVELSQPPIQLCRVTPPLIDTNQATSSNEKTYKTFLGDFHTRLTHFFEHIKEMQPHFVRCIKTNDQLQPDTFNRLTVRRQIQSMSIIETIELISEGLIYSFSFDEFRERYGFLVKQAANQTDVDVCKITLRTLSNFYKPDTVISSAEQFAFGRTRLFLNAHSHALLEKLRSERERHAASSIQRAFRRYIVRKRLTPVNRPHRSASLSQVESLRSGSTVVNGGNKPPHIPPQRRYTIVGGYKVGFPQIRRMRATYEGEHGEFKLLEGTQISVLGVSQNRGFLIVEHNGNTVLVPFQYTELENPMARPTTYL
ncbi:Unconventional myosin-IXb isoform X2 [Oopsacas minuta]|uniref:Unconventional myosin-IXb isoform X2 n=1 Tax=Oopsacas minuta TaxID=111878 RepID=A0AAV7KLB1_9METZ|nr:Unconventional myosin-IXb isoform X2 [Oopsacas minuta]